jgi:hypothetical protein
MTGPTVRNEIFIDNSRFFAKPLRPGQMIAEMQDMIRQDMIRDA